MRKLRTIDDPAVMQLCRSGEAVVTLLYLQTVARLVARILNLDEQEAPLTLSGRWMSGVSVRRTSAPSIVYCVSALTKIYIFFSV
jgi:hypothetical protein